MALAAAGTAIATAPFGSASVAGVIDERGGDIVPRVVPLLYVHHAFTGKVRKQFNPCNHNETVHILKLRPGADRKIGTPVTDERGIYSLKDRKKKRDGKYYAVVRERTLPDGTVCLRAKSLVLELKDGRPQPTRK
jgi:hypothetical protein